MKLPPSITERDYYRSATASMTDTLIPMLDIIKKEEVRYICDMGCGYGGVTRFIADYLGADEVVGLDIDEEVIEEVKKQKITFHLLNLETDQIPYRDQYFDLVVSFGVLEHLRYFDHTIIEAKRVLKKDGFLLLNVPNLASWIQRIGFLFGYQPRDVEISKETVPGRMWFYDDIPFGHLHSATLKAMTDLLQHYDFKILMTKGGRPLKDHAKWNSWSRIADAILSTRASLSRRINILAKK